MFFKAREISECSDSFFDTFVLKLNRLMSQELSDLANNIINCLYFVEPFEKIVEECGINRNIVADELKILISKKLVTPMKYDEVEQEYIRSFIYDTDHMDHYQYLATKDGLMAHHGI